MSKWNQQDIPDMTGKIVIITGANSGLGFESTKAIAAKGATIIMACRSMERGEKALNDVLKTVTGAKLDLMQLDNADLDSVRAFAEAFQAKYDRLDLLLNNAGVMAIPYKETADGFEMQLGVNHLAHFALTGLLIDMLIDTPNSRVHTVSSSANYMGSIDFDDLMGKNDYDRWGAYGQSKLANVFFTFELNKRLRAAGADTIANTSHPGLVMTNLQTNSVEQSGVGIEAFLYRIIGPIMSQDVSMGVLPQLFGSTAEDAKGGVFYGPQLFNLRGYPAEKKPNDAAFDDAALERFWEVSEELTGVKYTALVPTTA